MKTIKIILLVTVAFTFYACNTNMDDIMTADDIAALQIMETSYTNATIYNDSLAAYIDNTGLTNDETSLYFDDMYHQNDSTFESNHMMYSHGNSGDDHAGDSWMMGSGWMGSNGGQMSNGGMMGSGTNHGEGFNSSFCTADNLDLMDSLMDAHEQYHPGN